MGGGGGGSSDPITSEGGSVEAAELFKNITFNYETVLSDYPDITFHYKTEAETNLIDVGGSTNDDSGFINLTIEQFIDGAWYIIGIFGMSTGVDYRETPFKVTGDLITTWDIGRALRFTQLYISSDGTQWTPVVYYYFTDAEGLNGKLTYIQPDNTDLAVYSIINVEYGWHAGVRRVIFRGVGTLSNATSQILDARMVTVEGYNTLGVGAFKNANNIAIMNLPTTLTTILSEAFYGMTFLRELRIPTSVDTIGSSAFYGMTKLDSLIIPNAVTSIGEYAFYGTPKLKSLNLPTSLTAIVDNAFYGSSMRTLTIPTGVTSIGASAFYEMKSLQTLNLANTITSIGEYAFYDTRDLARIDIPSGVTSVGIRAFSGASGIASMLIPDTVTSIGSLAFEFTTSMRTLVLHAGVNTIADDAFTKSALRIVYIPSSNNLGVTSPSPPGTSFYGTTVTIYTLTTFEVFLGSSIYYANSGDVNPTISLYFNNSFDEPRLDVGPSTTDTEGFQTFDVSQFINNNWSLVYTFNMYNGQEYRGNQILLDLNNSAYSTWSKKVTPLRFTVTYKTGDGTLLTSVYYYYRAGLNGLNGKFGYFLVPSDITPPVITLSGGSQINVDWGSDYVEQGASADGGETVTIYGTVNTNIVGTYKLTYAATDSIGNIGITYRTVIVEDITSPTINVTNLVSTIGNEQSSLGSVSANEPVTWTVDNAAVYVLENGTVGLVNPADYANTQSYTFTITATDQHTNISNFTKIVYVVNLNAPLINFVNLVSNINDGQTALGFVTANLPATWSISNSAITISSSGVLTLNSPANYQSAQSYTYTITATGTSGQTNIFTKTVNVTDKTPPTINSDNLVNSINDGQTALGSVTASETVSWSVNNSNISVSTGGIVTLNSAANYQTASSYNYTITATDNGGNSVAVTKPSVTVVDTTSPVIDSSLLVSSISDGATALGSVTSNEVSTTWSINNSSMSISNTGVVTLNSPANYLTTQSYTYTITATDAFSNQSIISTQVTVVDTTGPIITSTNLVSNIDDGDTALGSVTSNEGSTTWSINNSSMSISNTGVVTLDLPANYQTATSYTYIITATDSFGNTSTVTKTVTVIDTTLPTMTITATKPGSTTPVASGQTTNDLTLSLTFTASEPTLTFSAGSITTQDGSIGTFVKSSDTMYTAIFTPTQDGECSIVVANGAFQDLTGNNNQATSTSTFTWTRDTSRPDMTITAKNSSNVVISSDDTTTDTSIILTLSSNRAIETGTFTSNEITVTNGTITNFTPTSSSIYTATFRPTVEETYTIKVNANAFLDTIGNNNLESNTFIWTYLFDTVPIITSGTVGIPQHDYITATGQTVYTITASDVVGSIVSFAIGGTDANLLTVNSSTGVVTLNAAPDYASKSSYSFNVTTTDDGGNTSTAVNVTFVIITPLADSGTHRLGDIVTDWISDPNQAKFTVQNNVPYYGSIANWNTTQVTDMSLTFSNKSSFNDALTNWDTSKVTNMESMFSNASSFNQSVSNFDTSKVTNMESMFSNASSFNQSVSNFDTSKVTNMDSMFFNCDVFNQSVSNFDTSKVTIFNSMFDECLAFNQSVSHFDTRQATTMTYMFRNCSVFNQYVRAWVIGQSVSTTFDMFSGASAMISTYNAVTGFNSGDPTTAFFNVGGITSGTEGINMRDDSGAGQTVYTITTNAGVGTISVAIGGTDATSLTLNSSTGVVTLNGNPNYSTKSSYSFTVSTTDSGTNYTTFPTVVTFTVVESGYTGLTALANHGGNHSIRDTVTSWVSDPTQAKFTNPTNNPYYGHISRWDTRSVTSMNLACYNHITFNDQLTNWDTSNVTDMSYMFYNCTAFNKKLFYFDTSKVTNMSGMFYECSSFNQSLSNFDTSKVTNMDSMFYGCSQFNQSVAHFDTGNVTTMTDMFKKCTIFNQYVRGWMINITNNTYINNMFIEATAMIAAYNGVTGFNSGDPTLDFFNVGGITSGTKGINMRDNSSAGQTVYTITTNAGVGTVSVVIGGTDANSLNLNSSTGVVTLNGNPNYSTKSSYSFTVSATDSGTSNTVSVTVEFSVIEGGYSGLTALADSGTHSIFTAVNSWVSDPTQAIFTDSTNNPYYGHISRWDTRSVTTMNSLFFNKPSFNDQLTNWDTSNVTNMLRMFRQCGSFNQSLQYFDTSKVTNMNGMFIACSQFNQPVSNFNTSQVTRMTQMFYECSSFNQSVSNFDTSKVIYMDYMFYGCAVFNQSVSNFDTGKVINMYNMFGDCGSFNQSVSNFDTSKVTDMRIMFQNCTIFNQYVRGWRVNASVSNMFNMFFGATAMIDTYSGVTGFGNANNNYTPTVDFFNVGIITSGIEGINMRDGSNAGQTVYTTTTTAGIGSFSFAIGGTDASSLTLDSSTGVVTLNDNPNYSTKSTYSFTVSATDSGTGNTNSTIVTISVIEVGYTGLTALTNHGDSNSIRDAVSNWMSDPTQAIFTDPTNVPYYGHISRWDTRSVTNMSNAFNHFPNNRSFNDQLTNWDTSNVTDMERMFRDCDKFNQPVSYFDTSKVTDMQDMFQRCGSFNQSVSNFDTSKVTTMAHMFSGCGSFNQSVSNFDTSKVIYYEQYVLGLWKFSINL